MGDIVTYTEYVGMTIEDLKPYLETLTASLDLLTEVTFAVGVMLAAWDFFICLFVLVETLGVKSSNERLISRAG